MFENSGRSTILNGEQYIQSVYQDTNQYTGCDNKISMPKQDNVNIEIQFWLSSRVLNVNNFHSGDFEANLTKKNNKKNKKPKRTGNK